ncbi:hypothetical protein EON79_20665 [bacterium]|nr:MAG: hypothetical protein EON79_20665 [bacterium]
MGADTPRSELRQDGFPGLGVPLPDLGLPRLMLLGRTVRYFGDVLIGQPMRRTSRITKLSPRETKSGKSAVVTVSHELNEASRADPLIVETQTYIMMEAGPAVSRKDPVATPAPAVTAITVVPDETLLFQYSALAFNSHRIHLDRNYARDVEGFPDLVVNGGLATLLLTEHLRTTHGAVPRSLSTRHMRPLLCGRPMGLQAEEADGKWSLSGFDETGLLALAVEVET